MDVEQEVQRLKEQMEEVLQTLRQLDSSTKRAVSRTLQADQEAVLDNGNDWEAADGKRGAVYYSGQLRFGGSHAIWEPQERSLTRLLELPADKAAKVLAALGHKQRLDILQQLLQEPLTGTEIVERLHMGTTGQLYHHLKALQGAGLLVQEERGGRYRVVHDRILPLLLLMAAASDLLDTSDYIAMAEVRSNASAYLGPASEGGYDPGILVGAVLENSLLEHRAGHCSEVHLFEHDDGSVTIADNGRGIPVTILTETAKPAVQSVLTDLQRTAASAPAPGAEKGIAIAVVNALSEKLTVEIRRDGRVFRQDYRNGIPQSPLLTVGTTKETGTSVTFKPNPELFDGRLNREQLSERLDRVKTEYPDLAVQWAPDSR